jgi:class 3 adenylate cyclase
MAEEDVKRRLAVILAADVVGYSQLIGLDEEGTLQQLRDLRARLIDPAIQAHRGRLIKTMGDGFLVEFASVVDAVRSAVELQRGSAAEGAEIPPEGRVAFRVGIHLGDVVAQADGDLLGDTVNIAARLEAISEPGGVFLSEDAYRQVRDRLKEEFVDLGEKRLKNIARPIGVFAIKVGRSAGLRSKDKAGVSPKSGPHDGIKVRQASEGSMRLPTPIRVRAPGLHSSIETVQEAMKFIEHLPTEMANLPRWTFAKALLSEALQTGKSRDLKAAARQLTQALRNERWLDEPSPSPGET